MLQKLLIFIVLIAIFLTWYFIKKPNGKYLLFSFVITCIPFQISIPVFSPTYLTESGTGTFTSKFFLTIPLIVSVFLLISRKNLNLFRFYRNDRWTLWILLLIVISLFNPLDFAKEATLAFGVYCFSYILFFRIISNLLTPVEIVEGVFLSLVFLCGLQFILAILYPLLGVSFVTTVFQAGGEQWATRVGTRPGAIGIFVTPANLGLFTTIVSGFFFATYLSGFKKKLSLFVLSANVITIILTYSRTSYITLVFVLFLMYFIYKNSTKPLFSFKSIVFGIAPALLFLYWLIYFSPFSSIFLKTDADDMYQARLDHWIIGMQIFKTSPVIGVGINSHVEYINHQVGLYKSIHNEFLTINPIHNTHIIILAETGLIGFTLWLVFLLSSVVKAKNNISINNNIVFSLTQIGLLITYVIYGFTDWAPLSLSTFPIFLLFTFFSNKFSLQSLRDINIQSNNKLSKNMIIIPSS